MLNVPLSATVAFEPGRSHRVMCRQERRRNVPGTLTRLHEAGNGAASGQLARTLVRAELISLAVESHMCGPF
jgi:hypothetical protein